MVCRSSWIDRAELVVALLACLPACSGDDTQAATTSTATTTTGAGGGGSGGAGGGAPTGPIDGAVGRYDIAFDLASRAATFQLGVDVAPPGGDCWSVACGLPVTDVTWNDAPATSGVVDGNALAACGPGVPGGGALAVAARTVVPEQTFLGLDVGYSVLDDMDGGKFSYLLSWVGGCDRFGPCDDDPSRLVEVHLDVTHPEGTTVLCPGLRTDDAGGTHCDIAGTLAPTYSGVALAADPLWVRTPFTQAAGVDLVFYEVPSGKLAASLDPTSVGAFMDWITGRLGPFPYGNELRFAGGPTAWLGFEHPANIILYEDLPSLNGPYGDPTMHVTMHEVVHQWAGDRTTLASTLDFVWKEATAEYLAYVFEDEQRPPGEAAASLAYWDAASLGANWHPRPLDEPPPDVEDFYGDVYGPGPMVLYVQLESLLRRDKVLTAIASFLAQPGARSVDDLQKALEAASGSDLQAYFDAWVYGTGMPEWPTVSVAATQQGDQVNVTLTQLGATPYGCVVEVDVVGATSTATALVDFGPAPTAAQASADVTLAEPFTSLVVDPRHRLVAKVMGAADPPPVVVWPL